MTEPWPHVGSRWTDDRGRVFFVTGVRQIGCAASYGIESRCMVHVTREGGTPHPFDWWPQASFLRAFTRAEGSRCRS